ncbi:UDP-N-acetylglucosamine--N-acetylmuramyl-(pentapeptide) pyrophosphoryl-undecaprenol N-acetylglucosamine transferase [Litorimonas cladophorae]|uniref:UDP-N-acetylglucosamine--N-acetylmuramyl-(pentapeptide) pyrophosphoryl-undecaprenol N-acetylglucosamine transferase n=2 Tax=Litorimonas cladophorae TaxID=1220491 RepID=A0A918NBT2_9PROT|nr:UDP-N-acetylglucosamine--N-acetylmuramyl-(pentapeptide) pyrophosphoryl-undecaprenol N-acetylglucosamine transferase [Litorimonas cladophorae]
MNMGGKILLAAGGTGGHMFPAQALAESLKALGWDIALMTDARGLKHSRRIPADPIVEVQAASISPRKPIQAIKGALKLAKGVSQAKQFIRDWKPDIVVGFGGYPAFPAMRAAQSAGLPTILHEQNAVLGRVNRVFAAKANHVVSGFEILKKVSADANVTCLGNPMRAQISAAVPTSYDPPENEINLLIVGGSLGARILSETLPKAIALLSPNLRSRLNVVQQTTESAQSTARQAYNDAGVSALCETFFSDIEIHLAKAHYIVARAGASSVSEIALMGKPSLLIPLAIAMDDHQTINAQSLERHGAADILPESEFTPESVANILEDRLNDSSWLSSAATAARSLGRPNAAHDLTQLVICTTT